MKKTYEINPAWIRPSQSELVNKATALIGLVASLTIFGAASYFSDKRDVERYADINNDGIVSTNEWKEVYREVGVEYNPPNLRGLTWEQRINYLESHDHVKREMKKKQEEQKRIIRFSGGK